MFFGAQDKKNGNSSMYMLWMLKCNAELKPLSALPPGAHSVLSNHDKQEVGPAGDKNTCNSLQPVQTQTLLQSTHTKIVFFSCGKSLGAFLIFSFEFIVWDQLEHLAL